jgi:hypothetical protein
MKTSLCYFAAAMLIPTAAMSQTYPTDQVQDIFFTAFQLSGSTFPPPNSMVLQFESEINAYDYNANTTYPPFTACGTTSDATASPDDSSCLQAWLNAVMNTLTAPAKVIYARLPPARRSSGWYDICAGITIPSGYGDTIYIFGGAKLRVLPGCTTPPTAMVTVGPLAPDNINTILYLSDLTLDGKGLPRFVLELDHTNIMLHNMHVRNAAPATSVFGALPMPPALPTAPLYVEGGGQIFIDGSNRFECINDPPEPPLYPNYPYSSSSTQNVAGSTTINYCTYDVWFDNGHDSKISDIVAVGAAYANIFDNTGNGNSWIHPQTYNYNANKDPTGKDMEAYQGILIDDHAHLLLNPYVGQTNNYGIHVQHVSGPTANQNLLILGGDVIAPGSTPFVAFAMDPSALVSVSELQFQSPFTYTCAAVLAGGTLAATSVFSDNSNCTFTWGGNAVSVGPLTVNGTITFQSLAGGPLTQHLCVTPSGSVITC